MNTQEKQRKSSVFLCRSSNKGLADMKNKEIQGLVFDHPSMPKIVTVSSVRKKSSSSENTTDQHPPQQYHIGHRTQEQNPTGHRTQKQNPTGHRTQEQNPTGHRVQEKHFVGNRTQGQYPTGHRAQELHVNEHYNHNQYHGRHSFPKNYPAGNRPQERIPTSQHPQGPYPSVYHQLLATTGHRVPMQYPIRSSPPALIHTSGQYSIPQQIQLGGLSGFRQSNVSFSNRAKAAERVTVPTRSEMSALTAAERSQVHFPSYRRQTIVPATTIQIPTSIHSAQNLQRARHETISQPRTQQTTTRQSSSGGLPQYSQHGVRQSESAAQYSETAGRNLTSEPTHSFSRDFHLKVWRESHEQVLQECAPARGLDQPARLAHTFVPHSRSSSTSAGAPPSLVKYTRRYSTGHSGVPSAEKDGEHNSGQPLELTDANVWITGELNTRVQNTEGTISRLSNAGNRRASSNNREEDNPVVRCSEDTNSEASSPEDLRITPSEGVSEADKLERRQRLQENRRRQKQQRLPKTVVVISDSDDETELRIASPNSLYDSDQDVFTVTQKPGSTIPTPETNSPQRVVVGDSQSSCSPTASTCSESEAACYITKVKGPHDESDKATKPRKERVTKSESRNLETAASYKTCQHSRAQDVNNNLEKSQDGLGSDYRSVLCEREIVGYSGTQSVIVSEKMLFDKDARGIKRTLNDKAEYLVARSTETAEGLMDSFAKKIRRMSSDDLDGVIDKARQPSVKENSNNRYQSSQYKRDAVPRGHDVPKLVRSLSSDRDDVPKLVRSLPTVPKLIRSRSENDEHFMRQNHKVVRFSSLTNEPQPSTSQLARKDDFVTYCESKHVDHDFFECRKLPSKSTNESGSHCNVCVDKNTSLVRVPDASDVTSRDEFQCRSCDRVLNEKQSPGTEVSHSVVKLPKAGPKPTGIVVGVKQAPEVNQPLESDTEGSVKLAKNCGIIVSDDVIRDGPKSKTENGFDILHFKVVKKDADVTWRNTSDHGKRASSLRDQAQRSQQWEAYSLKLEQDSVVKTSCGEGTKKARAQEDSVHVTRDQEHGVIKRNSWEELKRKLLAEQSESLDRNVMSSKEEDGGHAIRKRAYSSEEVSKIPCKSPLFNEDNLAEQYKRRKLSKVSENEESPVIQPSEVESPVSKSPPPDKEDLSLDEWKDVLAGRIEQVKESIDEEKTPWKTKNKKKVLDKLENLYKWMTGPEFSEAAFASRKQQFFQTVRHQYELMKTVKSQRQTMKTQDNAPTQVVENVEALKEKVAKKVEVAKEKTNKIKKIVKCRPKSVKNKGHLMKKIRKAIMS